MEAPKSGFWIALGLGGLLIGGASFAQQAYTKEANESFRLRAVFRDFCIGAFLTAMIYMFLPESIESLISSVTGSFASAPQSGGAFDTLGSSPATTSADVELQLGPARF